MCVCACAAIRSPVGVTAGCGQVTQVWLLPVQVYIAAGHSYELETKLRKLEQSAKTRFGGTTDSELSELEDVVTLTAARVQSAESEVGGIIVRLNTLVLSHPSVGPFHHITTCPKQSFKPKTGRDTRGHLYILLYFA